MRNRWSLASLWFVLMFGCASSPGGSVPPSSSSRESRSPLDHILLRRYEPECLLSPLFAASPPFGQAPFITTAVTLSSVLPSRVVRVAVREQGDETRAIVRYCYTRVERGRRGGRMVFFETRQRPRAVIAAPLIPQHFGGVNIGYDVVEPVHVSVDNRPVVTEVQCAISEAEGSVRVCAHVLN